MSAHRGGCGGACRRASICPSNPRVVGDRFAAYRPEESTVASCADFEWMRPPRCEPFRAPVRALCRISASSALSRRPLAKDAMLRHLPTVKEVAQRCGGGYNKINQYAKKLLLTLFRPRLAVLSMRDPVARNGPMPSSNHRPRPSHSPQLRVALPCLDSDAKVPLTPRCL